MSLQQCMGGWCAGREKCPHYWEPMNPGVPPSERLCATGRDWERLQRNPDAYRMEAVQPIQPEVMEP
jgi:hypothetical protein